MACLTDILTDNTNILTDNSTILTDSTTLLTYNTTTLTDNTTLLTDSTTTLTCALSSHYSQRCATFLTVILPLSCAPHLSGEVGAEG